jgi:hypothetical protein
MCAAAGSRIYKVNGENLKQYKDRPDQDINQNIVFRSYSRRPVEEDVASTQMISLAHFK